MPFFFFSKGASEVKIFGRTPTETIKFSFIASAFLRGKGIESSEIRMSDPVPIPQGAPMGGANAPLPPVASANNAGWNVAGSQAAAAAAATAANAPLPAVASANDAGWNIAGSRAAAQHLPNAVYEKMHANMSRAAARRAAMVGGGKRRFTRRVRKSTQSKKSKQSRQSRKAVQSSRSRSCSRSRSRRA